MSNGIANDVTDVVVGDRVAHLLAGPLADDEIRPSQHPQMLRHQRLAHLERGDQFVNALLTVRLQLEDHPEPDSAAQDLEQLSPTSHSGRIGKYHNRSMHEFACLHT